MAARIILSLTASLLILGCSSPPAFVVPELPLPPEPVLPTVGRDEFVVVREEGGVPVAYEISRDVYNRLVLRDAIRRRHGEECRAIIAEHNKSAP